MFLKQKFYFTETSKMYSKIIRRREGKGEKVLVFKCKKSEKEKRDMQLSA